MKKETKYAFIIIVNRGTAYLISWLYYITCELIFDLEFNILKI